MLGPSDNPPFTLWSQVNALLTRPNQWVIIDLSWQHPPSIIINGCTPRETYLGTHHKMHLPSWAQDLVQAIMKAGKSSFFSCCDIAKAYQQLTLDPVDYHLCASKYTESTTWMSACDLVFTGWQLAAKTSPASLAGSWSVSDSVYSVILMILEASPALRLRQPVISIACVPSLGISVCKRLHTRVTHHHRYMHMTWLG